MKQKRKTGLIKGKSTAVLVSLGLHLTLLVGATSFVVFKIITRDEVIFTPPPKQDRPKMKLKKLRVKVKQNTRPKRQASRITAKTTSVMPEIQLPEMTGLGGGLSDSIGGFQMIANLGKMSLLGGEKSIGNDLEGTFYDLKRLRNGSDNPDFPYTTAGDDKIFKLVNEYIENGWDQSVFHKFYRSPKRLYATQFMVPPCNSIIGPSKFGITDPNFVANNWVAVYRGNIGYPKGGRFRFWGVGDDVLVVGINGEWVLDASHEHHEYAFTGFKRENEAFEHHLKHMLGLKAARVGNWFTIEPGEPVQMDLLIAESPGGTFCMMLLVEQEGVEYEENEYGAPIIDMFKTMEPPQHIVDEITYQTVPNRFYITRTNAPIFGIY